MPKLEWGKIENKRYEAGVEKVALFLQDSAGKYPSGVAWDGVTNISESPSGAEPTKLYADNKVFLVLMSNEELGVSISAYMYPDEFEACQGHVDVVPGFSLKQQTRKPFGLAYVTLIGDATEGIEHGYKLHLVYGILASPTEEAHPTINESVEPQEMSWDCTTTPVQVPGFKATSSLSFSSLDFGENMKALEDIVFGSDSEDAKLPLPSELITMFKLEPEG